MTRVSSSDADKHSTSPPKTWVAVLLFGSNTGLVRERADACARSIVPDLNDGFRVADLGADVLRKDPARLGDEVGAISMFGGRRVVRVRDATDGLSETIGAFIEAPVGDAFIVVEAGELTKTSSLRKLFEGAKGAGAIECYDDKPEDASRLIREVLEASGWKAEADALAYLTDALQADRRLLRSELEKLSAYMGSGGGVLTRAEAVTLIGDSGAVEADEIADAVVAGDLVKLDRLIVKTNESNVSWTGVAGAALRLFQRLAAAAEGGGGGGSSWGRSSYYEQRMQSQLVGWDPAKLTRAMMLLSECEAQTRTTGLPEAAIAQHALLQVTALKRRA